MRFTYPMIIHDDPDGFWGEFPDLPGCVTQGDTLNELMLNAEEAMEGYLLTAFEHDIAVKSPSNFKDITSTTSAYPTLISSNIDLAKNTKSVKKTLTIPEWLNEKATSMGINFSQTLQEALIAKIA